MGQDAILNLTTAIEPDPDGKLPTGQIAAYVYSGGGHLLSAAPLDEAGAAKVGLTLGEHPAEARILVGPKLDTPDLTELLRRGAIETHARLDPRELSPIEIAIGHEEWFCWFLSRCTARGTVLKRTMHDGEPLDLPVCNAEVEIYEVDPIHIIVPRLPDDIIARIRDELLIPIPIPDPDPGPLKQLAAETHEQMHMMSPGATVDGGEPHELAQMLSHPAAATLAFAAKAGNLEQLRRQLVLNPDITRMILCLYPRWVTKTLIGTATTDTCGHFRYTFHRGCKNHDQPDLYFRVLQPLFFGLRIPIYEPTPVSCYTHWDYVSGTEVTIYTTSPLARTCTPCPPLNPGGNGAYVTVLKVGNLLTSNIHGVTTAAAAADRGLTLDGRPFGGMLNPHLEFDPQLLDSMGVSYYRVTLHKPGVGPVRELDEHCYRRYVNHVGTSYTDEVYDLGPTMVGSTANLMRIPPGLAPNGAPWSTPNSIEDEASAKWSSTIEAPGMPISQPDKSGLFELRFELFHADGSPVDMAAAGIVWLVPLQTSVAGASQLDLVPPAPGIVQGNAFILPLHVDNNPCEASIGAPVLNGSTAADPCGVMRYHPPQSTGGTVQMPYTATHRNGYATYTFTVKRGTNVLTPPTTAGPVGAGAFNPTESVFDLLSLMPAPQPPMSPPCTIGAFLEEVYVYSLATDGWQRVGADASASRAFTLAPE
jgi:hypothetical protein